MNQKNLAFAAVAACSISFALGQSGTALKIGDPAPQLKVSAWIKGTPTESFDTNKIYVVEFWATWCIPCRQVMPHLSELAQKYAGKVIFDSCDVAENPGIHPTAVLAKVKQFVTDMGDKMSYNVAMDTSDGFMAKNWLAAAGQGGIPAAFLIKGGQIIWIGQPEVIEKTIEQVLAGTYDEAAFAKEFEQKSQVNTGQAAKLNALLEPLKKAMDAKDYPTAIKLIDAGIVAAPMLKEGFYLEKFQALLGMDPSKAIDFVKKWHGDSPERAIHAVGQCADQDGLPADVYRLGVTYEQEALGSSHAIVPLVYDTLAKFYFKLGDIANAVSSEEKAIDLGNKAIQAGQYSGSLLPGDVRNMQDALVRYKAAEKQLR